jgi:enoyl-CoA hydratase
VTDGSIIVEERDDRVVVTLNRPDTRNAIDADLVDALHDVCGDLERAPRLLLLTGSGGIFAGEAEIAHLGAEPANDMSVFERIRRLPMPSIAAVDGSALGRGAELAYACDLRICTSRAFFGQPEAQLGIVAGACLRLPALVGEGLAKELLFTGRRVTADEALTVRLVNRVVAMPDELVPAAHAILDEIAQASSLAIRRTKLAIDAPTVPTVPAAVSPPLE